MKVTGKAIIEALAIIAAADPADVALARLDRDHLTKALIDGARPDSSFDPNGYEPRREVIETGPSFGASGRGASEMTRHYSKPAEQLVSTRIGEALSRLIDDVAEVEKAVARLDKNQRLQLGLLARVSKTVDPSLSKSILELLKTADKEDVEDEDDAEGKGEDEREETAKKAAGMLAEVNALLANMGNGTPADVVNAMLGAGARPLAKGALVDAIVAGLDADVDAGVISPAEGLAGKNAAMVCKAAFDGACLPGLAKSKIDVLPAAVAQRFNGLFQ